MKAKAKTVSLTFSSRKTARITGASLSDLANWRRRDFLKPKIGGAACRYDFDNLVAIKLCVHLISGGIEPRKLHKVVDYLRKRRGGLSTSSILASTRLVITDTGDVCEVDGDKAISTLERPGQLTFSVVVPLYSVVCAVQKDAELAAQDEDAA